MYGVPFCLSFLQTLLTEETGKMVDGEGKTVMHTAAEMGESDDLLASKHNDG